MDPPDGTEFKDITHLFRDASKEMEIDELLMVEGFTLYEAMSAVEIGDPRMDSGAALLADEQQQPDFDPLTPLIPEEVCWILDRSMACEMHWHAGNALAQTVYTCLYMHQLPTISHDYISCETRARFVDRGLPVQLVSMVLRAGIMGMVKCCDLTYRELIKGNVHDCEDWQGEKSDTSLLESLSAQRVVESLDEAETWLMFDENDDLRFRSELLYRIQLRKTLLRLFTLELPRKTPFLVPLLAEARSLLSLVKHRPIDLPESGSPAYAAFDPRITRRLHSIMPMRPLTLPSQTETWKAVEGLLDGWESLYRLASCESLLSWNTVGLLKASNQRWTRSRLPFIRSLAQSVFSNGSTIMDRFAVSWLMEHFFLELAHIPFGHIVSLFEVSALALSPFSFEEFHSTLSRLLVQHIWASYHNRPRQRRHSMKTYLDWHMLYDTALAMTAKVRPRESADSRVLKCIPLAILHWRAGIARDIIFSGFELELYHPDERSFAYWFLSEILTVHEAALNDLVREVPEGAPAHAHLRVQIEYIALLREMSLVCFMILCRLSKLKAARRWTNLTIRYKWVFRENFEAITTPDPFLPDFEKFLRQERATLAEGQDEIRKKVIQLFNGALARLTQLGLIVDNDIALQLCRTEFTQHHLAGFTLVCKSLKTHVSRSSRPFSEGLTWDLDVCPWFPQAMPAMSSDNDP